MLDKQVATYFWPYSAHVLSSTASTQDSNLYLKSAFNCAQVRNVDRVSFFSMFYAQKPCQGSRERTLSPHSSLNCRAFSSTRSRSRSSTSSCSFAWRSIIWRRFSWRAMKDGNIREGMTPWSGVGAIRLRWREKTKNSHWKIYDNGTLRRRPIRLRPHYYIVIHTCTKFYLNPFNCSQVPHFYLIWPLNFDLLMLKSTQFIFASEYILTPSLVKIPSLLHKLAR